MCVHVMRICGSGFNLLDCTTFFPSQSGETHQVMQYEFIGWISSELPVVTDFVHFVSEASKAIDENSYTNNAILVHDT